MFRVGFSERLKPEDWFLIGSNGLFSSSGNKTWSSNGVTPRYMETATKGIFLWRPGRYIVIFFTIGYLISREVDEFSETE
jgi:hypothetical protein